MVRRVFVEKRKEFAHEAGELLAEIKNFIKLDTIDNVRVINRYDVDGIDDDLFDKSINTVFSEPQVDDVYLNIKDLNINDEDFVFAVELLPGQFDQRAESASECIQMISQGIKPIVKSAKLYILPGTISDADKSKIKKLVINPVEARETTLDEYTDLNFSVESPDEVEILTDFNNYSEAELEKMIDDMGLAMDKSDLAFTQDYFKKEGRAPTITEIRVIDTYWSDHCRHTTFNTIIDSIEFEDESAEKAYQLYLKTREELGRIKPISLMDIGTIAAKYLRSKGELENLDESEEINACTAKIKVKTSEGIEDWLLLFKNETHNHPTEIEPFGGAATCIGGAIRDPLSGRSYVYSAMRVTGAGNPLVDDDKTLEGKLPQRKIVTTAAKGYSSYGNQIGLATGQVDEIYHEGYVAKRMEVGAVVAAAPAENVIRERPVSGDIVLLLGGKTGRDGCGGATGSSKSHTTSSIETAGAEVQKGNAPEERKLQRLFRNPEASKLIKRCNDFGAGGVSVAIGELADGLDINLDKVQKKYEGLDGTELAISESQERMAVVVEVSSKDRFMELAEKENLQCTHVATVSDTNRLVMKWHNNKIVDISRDFLDTNGTEKHIEAKVNSGQAYGKSSSGEFSKDMKSLVGDLNVCSKRGLSEMFDSTIGAGTVIMPFGGKHQRTPNQAMVNLISMEEGTAETCSIMSWGFNPYITERSPFDGAYLAVIESVSKLVASGASFDNIYLSFQEYFEKLETSPEKWGKPLGAVLGAFKAQYDLGVAAIGGKDSMSGSFENLHVPPTLISFAVTTEDVSNIVSGDFKGVDHKVITITPEIDDSGLPNPKSLKETFKLVHTLIKSKDALSVYTAGYGGIAESIYKMCIGNGIGFVYDKHADIDDVFAYNYGTFVIELSDTCDIDNIIQDSKVDILGVTTSLEIIDFAGDSIDLHLLDNIYEGKLEPIYKFNTSDVEAKDSYKNQYDINKNLTYSGEVNAPKHAWDTIAKPKVLIPVFPGTNCEYDSAKAFTKAGAEVETFIVNNLSSKHIEESANSFAEKISESQIIFIPGGFSSGDEPDGSGKFITAFFRNEVIKTVVEDLLDNRDGLIAGICNGFQALIKLGLLPYGKILDTDSTFPTLTLNKIGRHQSKIVNIKVLSNDSPWLAKTKIGDVYKVPISHGEGRFVASEKTIDELLSKGQINTQYVDLDGNPTYDIHFNPNGSYYGIECITSPDGRILGKMGHSERIGDNLYKNVLGEYDMKLFESAVDFFK